ncbi:MAG: hypothetical protein NC430_07620 [bacterium]|nr:hypothetical protein [bacterium]
MDKKKRIIILAAVILALIVAGGIGTAIFLRGQDDKYVKSAAESDISRYEWMEMLCEQEGITEYQNAEPYYTDVSAENSYFDYIQSAVEWDVLEEEKKFAGNSYASGRFVLLTAMKSLGERNLKLYLDTDDSITDAVYLQAALECDLLTEEELPQGISGETAERVLEQLAELKYTEFWADDYEKVVYQDGVVEIASEDILEKKQDGLEITVSKPVLSDIAEGTIVVYQPDQTGLKAAKRVNKVETGGKLTLVDNVKQEEVLESLVVSDIVELTAQDIFNYYGMQAEYSADNMVYRQGLDGNAMPVWKKSKEPKELIEWKDKGFKIEVSVEEGKKGEKNYLEIKITDHNTNMAYTLPFKQNVSWESGCQAELDVSQIYAAAHMEFEPILDLKYAEAALDIQSTFMGKIKTESSKESARVKLFETPKPLGSGALGVDILVYLVVSVEGEISLEAELPANFCVKYDEKGGIRRDRSEQKEKKVELDVDCEADFMLRVEPVLICLFHDVMDVELDFGLAMEFEEKIRSEGMVCLDLSAAFPVLKISVSGDDKKDTFIGDKGISAEWELISKGNAPFHKNVHAEIANGVRKVVAECTYDELKKEEDDGTEPQQENGFANTYVTQFGNTRFAFDYPDGWTVTREEANDSEWNGDYLDYYREIVELTNDRGMRITYTQYKMNPGDVGSGSAFQYRVEYNVEKAADSRLKLGNAPNSEKLIVARIQELDSEYGNYSASVSGRVSYAVLLSDKEGLQTTNLPGYDEMCAFYYPEPDSYQVELPGISTYSINPYTFIAYSPDGQFTEEEETEVIAILKSFREE